MKKQLLNIFKLRTLLLATILCTVFTGRAWGAEEVYKTALFGSSYNSKSLSSYTDSWTSTNDGFTVDIVNFNNNNNGWAFIRCGSNKAASVATIITNAAIDKAVTKVSVTIDAITAANVNSIKLYTSSNNSTWTEAGSFTAATGAQEVSLASPAANLYYKVEFDCNKGSKNGFVQVSKVEYYYDNAGGGSETQACANPTFSPAAGSYIGAQSVELSTTTEEATIYYTLDGSDPDANSSVYTSAIAVNENTTIKAIAVKDGMVNSAIVSATYTIGNLVHAGTAQDPYTVADAFTAIDANEGLTEVYATGIVSKIVTAYNSQYGNISYNISADGTEAGDQLQAFRGKSYNGENFTSADDIQVGDEVVIYGNLTKYGSTYEFAADNQLVSLNRAVSEEPSIDVATTSVMVDYTGEENGEIEVTYNNIDDVIAEVQWFESDGLTSATYDWITAEIDANNNISYIIGENNTGAPRTAYLKVYALDNDANDVYSELITITQAKAPEEFTVTYFVAGEEFTTTRQEGAALNLPDPGTCGGYQFAGWSTANDAAAPEFVENTAAVNSALTLYAIFAKEVGETVYTKVTATEDITDGKYLIVYEDGNLAFDGSLETLDASGNTIEVEISDNTIASSETVDAATFTIDATAGTIQSASGKYIGQTTYGNGLKVSDSSSYTNTFSIDDEGNVVITAVVGDQNPTLRYNDASGDNNLRFRYYKSGQKAIQLYKQIASATYTLNEPEATITAAANATWVAPAKVKITSDDVKVYTVTYDDAVGCTRKHEVLDKVVPANGVVLLTSDAATTVTLENTADEAAAYAALENDLLGSNGNVQGGTHIFCLAVGEKGLGFYPVDSSIKVPAGKAYLKIGEDPSSVEGAPSYLWFNGDTTAIDSLTTDTAAGNESGEIYSLTGQRVGKNYRGIVIMNGRKVLKK